MHKVGTPEEHLAARLALLEAEKELSRHGDELARRRRELPWVPVEKEYTFDTDEGQKTLRELFDGSRRRTRPPSSAVGGADLRSTGLEKDTNGSVSW